MTKAFGGKMKVLVASADNDRRKELGQLLNSWNFDVALVRDGLTALQKTQAVEENVLIVIMESNLEGLSTEELLFKMRNKGVTGYQYVIVMIDSCLQNEDLILLDAGADIIMERPISKVKFRIQMQVARRIMEHQMRQKVVQDDLWNQANQDVLTNIPNRRAILRALDRQANLSSGREQPLGLLMIDLDHFKLINDNFGHDGGDAVLREIAERMKNNLRTEDFLGRFGGEEFLAIIPNCTGEELMRLGERMRKSVNAPVQTETQLIPVSCSIGISVHDVTLGDSDPKVSLKRADKALYVAKEMGRNRVVSAWSLKERNQKLG
jgi:two-component system cell cycle response regulator